MAKLGTTIVCKRCGNKMTLWPSPAGPRWYHHTDTGQCDVTTADWRYDYIRLHQPRGTYAITHQHQGHH